MGTPCMLAYGGVAMSEGNLGTDQAAHTLHAGLWVVVMSEGAPAHTLYHSSEDAFLYMTHDSHGSSNKVTVSPHQHRNKGYISPIMSDNFSGW